MLAPFPSSSSLRPQQIDASFAVSDPLVNIAGIRHQGWLSALSRRLPNFRKKRKNPEIAATVLAN
jgi:hypothetical protein